MAQLGSGLQWSAPSLLLGESGSQGRQGTQALLTRRTEAGPGSTMAQDGFGACFDCPAPHALSLGWESGLPLLPIPYCQKWRRMLGCSSVVGSLSLCLGIFSSVFFLLCIFSGSSSTYTGNKAQWVWAQRR